VVSATPGVQEQQKNMMVLLGQQILASLNTARGLLCRSRNSSICFRFWWSIIQYMTAATEEWTGAGAASNKNNYSKLTGGKYGNKNIHRS
jgi:hypothetical protein